MPTPPPPPPSKMPRMPAPRISRDDVSALLALARQGLADGIRSGRDMGPVPHLADVIRRGEAAVESAVWYVEESSHEETDAAVATGDPGGARESTGQGDHDEA